MKKLIYIFLCAGLVLLNSCLDDLNQLPHVESTAGDVYANAANYKAVLGKLYAAFIIRAQEKNVNDDNADFVGNTSDEFYLRSYFNLQECGTDEVASTWLEGDNVSNLTFLSWDANDPWVSDMYYRIFYNIALCNDFLRNAGDEQIAVFTEAEQADIRNFRAEARFLRALCYYHAMDLFRNIPFVTENDPVGVFIPPRYEAKQVFEFIEKELKEIDTDLLTPALCEYGRASKAAAYTLLAKLYLNAEVYINTDHYADCVEYCKKVIDTGYYELEDDYLKLFNADNHKRTNEIIFAFPVDAEHTVTWGATTYIVCGAVGTVSKQNAGDYGVTDPWGMFRARGELPELFRQNDQRRLFFEDGQSQYLDIIDDQGNGFFVEKWTNLTDAGEQASNTAEGGVNTDFPLFRLADIYLMLGEAVARGGAGSSAGEALKYVNELQERAFGPGYTPINTLDIDFFLEERARELYWECTRRTDLIRYNKFTTNSYIWQWKGGVKDGRAVDSKYNIYPIPSTDLTANPNLYNENY